MSAKLAILLVAGLFVTACASPELTRRYDSAEWVAATTPLVEASVFSIDPPGSAKTATLLSLTDRGQQQLIDELAEKSTNATALLESLGASIGKKKKPGLVNDLTVIKRRLVLSAIRTATAGKLPGDRIQSLVCKIENLTANTTFESWDKFSTVYGTVDLGKITLAQTASANLGVTATSAENSGDPVERGGDISRSRTLTEEVSLRQRYIALSGILSRTSASIVQEGVVGIDLAGNAFVDITLKLDPQAPEPVMAIGPYKAAGNWRSASEISVNRRFIVFPQATSSILGDVQCDYILRSVADEKSRRSVVEGDDKAVFLHGKTNMQAGATLIPSTQLDFKVWFVTDGAGNTLEVQYAGSSTALQFSTYEAAAQFMDWLTSQGVSQASGIKIGGKPLSILGSALLPAQVSRLSIDVRSP